MLPRGRAGHPCERNGRPSSRAVSPKTSSTRLRHVRPHYDRAGSVPLRDQEPIVPKPEVLFVCVHNAGRSQMAAGLLDHLAAGRIVVRSAGSDPAGQVDPTVVEVMRELDIDISKEFPKPLADGAVRAADVVVTMGCGDVCPVYAGYPLSRLGPPRPIRERDPSRSGGSATR